MENNSPLISPGQLVAMFLCARVFSLLTYSPQGAHAHEGSVVMLAYLIALGIYFLASIPLFALIKKSGGRGLLDCAFLASVPFGRAVTAFFLLFCILTAANSAGQFEFFLTSAIYTESSSFLFLILFLLAAGYAAWMGIEALGRFSVPVLAVFLISVGSLVIILAPRIDLVNVTSPFYNGAEDLLRAVYYVTVSNVDLAILPLFLPYVRGNSKGVFGWFLIGGTALFEIISFLTLSVADNFVATKLFPVYTLATMSEISLFQRLDFVHMALWVFIALIKTSVYLFMAGKLFGYLFTNTRKGIGLLAALLFTTAVSLLFSYEVEALVGSYIALISGVVWLGLFVLLPIVLLLAFRKKEAAS